MNLNHQQREVLFTIREAVARTAPKGSEAFEAGAAKACEMLLIHIDWLLEQVNAGHSIPLTVKVNPKWPFDAQVVRTNPPPTYAKPPAPPGPPPMASAPKQPAPQPPSNWREVLDGFAAKERGTAQAHIAAQLVDELTRAMDAQQPAPQPLPEDALKRVRKALADRNFREASEVEDLLRMAANVIAEDGTIIEHMRKKAQQPAPQPLTDEQKSAYDMIDRYLRNSLGDDDYAEFSRALEVVLAAHGIGEQP